MRLQTKRERKDTERLIRCLREKVTDLQEEVRKQDAANARMARLKFAAEGSIAGARAALPGPYRELKARCERQEKEIQRLQARLDDALGRTPAQIAAIESGKGEPRRQPVAE